MSYDEVKRIKGIDVKKVAMAAYVAHEGAIRIQKEVEKAEGYKKLSHLVVEILNVEPKDVSFTDEGYVKVGDMVFRACEGYCRLEVCLGKCDMCGKSLWSHHGISDLTGLGFVLKNRVKRTHKCPYL